MVAMTLLLTTPRHNGGHQAALGMAEGPGCSDLPVRPDFFNFPFGAFFVAC